MATPPPSRDSTLHDIHDDTSSHGAVVGKEKEMGQCAVGGDMKITRIREETPPIRNSDYEVFFETTLNVSNASQLLSLSHNLQSLTIKGWTYTGDLALKSLGIIDCLGFNAFPDEGFHTPNLNSIVLSNCQNLYIFPNFIKSLTSCISLSVARCPHIESFSNGGLPSRLSFLSIRYCDELTSQKDWGLENLKSLAAFCIRGGCIGIESFPEEKLLPKTITTLCITDLKSLRKLDDKGFQQLNALLKLEIYSCDVLQHLPKQGLPSTLSCFYICDCPMLTPKLKPGTGEYWHMVARIERIIIDNERVSESSYRYW